MKERESILEINGLSINLHTSHGIAKVVDGISFKIRKGEIFGLVGESGSGKTMTALSILKLLPPSAKIVAGSIRFENEELTTKAESEMQFIRGRKIGMIFQDPASSLNPLIRIGDQLIETIMTLKSVTRDEARQIAIELLESVGISDSKVRLNQYPFELSGGLKQRVMIAIALAGSPKLLIADEPTTNLDVTIQWQILSLIRDIRNSMGMSVLLITHNLGIVAMLCDRVAVMYAGKIVEIAEIAHIFDSPLHPYTRLLLGCVPRISRKLERLPEIKGEIADLVNPPSGCRFHPRCPIAKEVCSKVEPELIRISREHSVGCLAYHPEHGWDNKYD